MTKKKAGLCNEVIHVAGESATKFEKDTSPVLTDELSKVGKVVVADPINNPVLVRLLAEVLET